MLRTLIVFILIGALAWGAWLLAVDPGRLVLEWRSFYVSTSVAVAVGIIAIIIIIAALVYRVWWLVLGVPEAVGRTGRSRRQRKGVEALSKGMAAIAAGDAAVAKEQAARASELLDDRALTMLLQAQAAQLEGDESAAEKYFAALRDWPSTEFLGVRGLLTQAMMREDWEQALPLAKRAFRINRKSAWVVKTLFGLQKRMGRWAEARETLKELRSLRFVSREEFEAEDANLLYQQSLETKGPEAVSFAKKAFAEQPALSVAGKRLAELLIEEGDLRGAARRIEAAWERAPEPELAELYWRAKGADSPKKKLEAARKLAVRNAGHPESRITLAAAALAAGEWAQAREHLAPLAATEPTPRICRMMAELEEKQHGDLARAHTWLMRAAGEEIIPPQGPETTEAPHTEAASPRKEAAAVAS